MNFVERGDPVGNYSADPPNRLSNILFSDDIRHVGKVRYIGPRLGALQLDLANRHFAPDATLAEKLEGLALLAAATAEYHLPRAYARGVPRTEEVGNSFDDLFDSVDISLVAEIGDAFEFLVDCFDGVAPGKLNKVEFEFNAGKDLYELTLDRNPRQAGDESVLATMDADASGTTIAVGEDDIHVGVELSGLLRVVDLWI